MTETGLSLGTPHYMSPEQATADRDITHRSDLYSLASVLYEMLAGEPPFLGASAQAIIMKIVTEEAAPLTRLRKSVPPNVVAATAKALEKLPADRFASAAAFADALRTPGFTVAGATSGAASRPSRRILALVGVAALAIVAIVVALLSRPRVDPAPVGRFVIGFPAEAAPSLTTLGTHLAVSPDGSALVYAGRADGEDMLWLKRRDGLSAEAIPGTEAAFDPFFSPDGRQLGFITDHGGRALKVVSLVGGPPRVVTSQAGQSGVFWAPDGYLYFDGAGEGLQRVRPDGTELETLVPLDTTRQERGTAWPQVLPGGRTVVFRMRRASDIAGDFEIVAARIGSADRRVVTRAVIALPVEGHLLFVTADGTLLAAPFDEGQLALTGPPVALATGLRIYGTYGAVDIAVTATGDLYYVSGGAGEASTLQWVSRAGGQEPVDSAWQEGGEIRGVAISPDGRKVALDLVRSGAAGSSIWIKHLPGGPLQRLTVGTDLATQPSWSGDGRSVLFISEMVTPTGVFKQLADGSGSARLIAQSNRDLNEPSESSDGRWLIVRTSNSQTGRGDILAMELGRDTVLRPIVATPASETNPSLSPDGRWLTYVSNESGRREVYVRPFPDVDRGVWQVSTDGGTEPRWSHRGNELLFRGIGGSEMMVATVEAAPVFRAGPLKSLFRTDAVPGLEYVRYDVAGDDRRLLVVGHGRGQLSGQLVRVEHLFTELRRSTPR